VDTSLTFICQPIRKKVQLVGKNNLSINIRAGLNPDFVAVQHLYFASFVVVFHSASGVHLSPSDFDCTFTADSS
jgi:hypothetical protein